MIQNNLRSIRVKKNGDIPIDFEGRLVNPLDIRIYSNFKEERKKELNLSFPRILSSLDPSIEKFLEDFNSLPFVYTNTDSCSGLFREHIDCPIWESIRSISKRRQISKNFEEYYMPSSMHPLEFGFAYNLADPLGKIFLEDIKKSNDNPFSRIKITNVTQKVFDPYRGIMTEGVVNFWNNGNGILIIRNYEDSRSETKDFHYEFKVSGWIPKKAKELDKLRGLQIDNLHKVVLNYLKNSQKVEGAQEERK